MYNCIYIYVFIYVCIYIHIYIYIYVFVKPERPDVISSASEYLPGVRPSLARPSDQDSPPEMPLARFAPTLKRRQVEAKQIGWRVAAERRVTYKPHGFSDGSSRRPVYD